MPLLFSSCTVSIPIPNDTPSAFAALPLGFFDFFVFPQLILQILCALITLPNALPIFLFASQRSNNLTSSSSFFKMWAPPLHAVGFEILCKSASLRTVNYLRHLFVDASPPSFPSHLFCFSLSLTTHSTTAWCLPILDGSTLSHSLPPTAQQPTIGSQRTFFLLI